MRILLLGADGQVGWELQRSLLPLGEVKACNRQTANFEDLDKLQLLVRNYSPNIIVNASAYTAVDEAESNVDEANKINATAVGLLANEAKIIDAWFVHYSTDYVFDGRKTGIYVETDIPNPQSVYGKTKLRGEDLVIESGCNYLIFRTSWVYASRGENFVKTIINIAKEKDKLNVIDDQIGSPTSAELIADVTSFCLSKIYNCKKYQQNLSGLYHLVSGGYTSWYGFAQFVLEKKQELGCDLKIKSQEIVPIATSEYPLPAERPANSRLSTDKIVNIFGVNLPHWKIHVKRMIQELNI